MTRVLDEELDEMLAAREASKATRGSIWDPRNQEWYRREHALYERHGRAMVQELIERRRAEKKTEERGHMTDELEQLRRDNAALKAFANNARSLVSMYESQTGCSAAVFARELRYALDTLDRSTPTTRPNDT